MTFRAAATGETHDEGIASAEILFSTVGGIVDVATIPAGGVVKRVWIEVLTAFNAATTNVLLLGHAADDDAYIAAAGVTEGTPGVYPTGGAGPFAAETAERVVQVKYTQTGTAATTGRARAYVEYATAPA